jgi:hypothetical protein
MGRPPRKHERVSAAVPVHLDNGLEGLTRDLSPAGVYFVVNEDVQEGDPIRFTVEFDNPSGKLHLECSGRIVRVEHSAGKRGVAVQITESRLERRDPLTAAAVTAA